ncbi:MAG: DinB family protein [Planctomycetota bacterium]
MTQQELLADQIENTRAWTKALIVDLKGDDWCFQPGPGLAHGLFLCGHLAVAQDFLIHTRCLGKPLLENSYTDHFKIGGPVWSTKEHKYPAIQDILSTMDDVHRKTIVAIRAMSDSILTEPAFSGDGKPHPYYRDKCGAIGHCSRHEAFHAGQIATIRRLLGKAFLR